MTETMLTHVDTGTVRCRRCGRADLPILSNGLCVRCDEVLYGRKESKPRNPFAPVFGPAKWVGGGGVWV
jgi:hypothetical protein